MFQLGDRDKIGRLLWRTERQGTKLHYRDYCASSAALQYCYCSFTLGLPLHQPETTKTALQNICNGPLTGEARAQVIANNRSLRTIKNELESLCERDVINDEQYDLIMKTLPAEASLNSSAAPAPPSRNTPSASPQPTPPVDTFAAMALQDNRNSSTPTQPQAYTPPPIQTHNEIAHVVALYRYADADQRDLNFEPNDHISVTEYLNPEWWQGKNVRTGEEGIFPKNYVRVEAGPSALASAPMNEKSSGYGDGYTQNAAYPGQQQYQQPPKAGDPYAGPVPPMQMANQPTEHMPGKGQEMGKKFGKKLGNAAIFGAGATIGGSIVSSIF